MSEGFSYVVRTTIPDAKALDGFVRYLVEGHVADVRAAGAEHAEVVLVDVTPSRKAGVEARYRFPSRAAFEAYERDRAPALRAHAQDALRALGVDPATVLFERWTGEVLGHRATR